MKVTATTTRGVVVGTAAGDVGLGTGVARCGWYLGGMCVGIGVMLGTGSGVVVGRPVGVRVGRALVGVALGRGVRVAVGTAVACRDLGRTG